MASTSDLNWDSDKLVREPLLSQETSNDDEKNIAVYKKRWYILAILFFMCVCHGLIHNTWSPIQRTARAVFGWDPWMIDLMPALFCVPACFTIIPVGWLLDVKGLRAAVLLGAFMQFTGAFLRCIPTGENWTASTVLIVCGEATSGLVAPVPHAAGVVLSATWFPANQRTTSTAIASVGASIGVALSFVIGPLVVDDVGDNAKLTSSEKDFHYKQIAWLLRGEAIFMAILFLVVLIHYPSKPSLPPSRSSRIERLQFKSGLRKLSGNLNFIVLALVYGCSYGLYSAWNSILDQNLSEFGFSQRSAGWLGFIAIISGTVSGISFSFVAGRFAGQLKRIIIVFMACASVSILITNLILIKVLPSHMALLCVLSGTTGFFITGSAPFYFELGAEIAYPVAEGITTAAMKIVDFFLQSVFLIVSMNHLKATWVIWVTMISCGLASTILLFIKETYNRLNVDVRSQALYGKA